MGDGDLEFEDDDICDDLCQLGIQEGADKYYVPTSVMERYKIPIDQVVWGSYGGEFTRAELLAKWQRDIDDISHNPVHCGNTVDRWRIVHRVIKDDFTALVWTGIFVKVDATHSVAIDLQRQRV
jgi:hypothetical protein